MSTLQTRGQEIARKAAQCVAAVKAQNEDIQKKYGSLARKLPSLILANGLGQTLAFLKSKGYEKGELNSKKAEGLLYNHLSEHVLGKDQDLLTKVMGESSFEYRRHTTEVLAFASWLKRFAEAELGQEEGQ